MEGEPTEKGKTEELMERYVKILEKAKCGLSVMESMKIKGEKLYESVTEQWIFHAKNAKNILQ